MIDDQKSSAYVIYTEFGPDLRIPRPERLAAEFPSVRPKTRAAWLREFARIDDFVWKLAEKGGTQRRPRETVEAEVRQAFPFMNADAVSCALNRASYLAWHEGYA